MREQAAFIAQPSLGTVSRRAILQGGAAFLALGLNPSFSMSAVMPRDQKFELFAFKAPASDHSVFAVVLPDSGAKPMRRADAVVHIHAGNEVWALPIGSDGSYDRSTGPCIRRTYPFLRRKLLRPCGWQSFSKHPPARRSLTRPSTFGRRSVGETAQGRGSAAPSSRKLSRVIRRCRKSTTKSTPDLDHALLEEALASRLATMSLGAEDPEMRGHRLASILLPDVIRYTPGAPVGFNFAGRNGRHPSDSTQAVVDTMIAGVVLPGRASEAVRLASEFPYFSTPGVIS